MKFRVVFSVALVSAMVCVNVCEAETLQDALTVAYKTNPDLQAQRARLRVTDETYIQTRSQFAPTVSLQAQGSYDREHLAKSTRQAEGASNPNLPKFLEQNSVNAELVVSEPIFTSGRLTSQLRAANADVHAGREALRTTEANVLYNVILAYADIERDQGALDIRQLNLDMLHHQVDETRARQKAGEVTRTDVAQAEAQLAAEDALYRSAMGQLDISRNNFAAVVGHMPADLAPLPALVGVPGTLDEALKTADRDNPDLLQARYIETGSRAKIDVAKANLGPTVTAQVQQGYQGSLVPFDQRDLNRGLGITANVIVPLYSGGLYQSQVRQAFDQNAVDQMTVDGTRRSLTKVLATIWSERLVAQNAVEAQTRQVAAAKIAFEGMRKEYTAGERSTLDVLVAEETLRDAELSLNSAKHDVYVTGAAILQNMGLLEITNLVEIDTIYEPDRHLNEAGKGAIVPWQPILEKLDGIGMYREP